MDENLKQLLFDVFLEGFYSGVKVGAEWGENSLSPSELKQRCMNRFDVVLLERSQRGV